MRALVVGLSRRPLQVLGLLLTGASNERIAAALGTAARTVAAHVEPARQARRAVPHCRGRPRLSAGVVRAPTLLADRRRRSASRRRGTEHG
jgi:FixJ family two-component response regulator